jgi:hypothetical protein
LSSSRGSVERPAVGFEEVIMYTIDTMILRLLELKEIAAQGGKTPVAIGNSTCMQPAAIVEITAATPVAGICGTTWTYAIANTTEILRIT